MHQVLEHRKYFQNALCDRCWNNANIFEMSYATGVGTTHIFSECPMRQVWEQESVGEPQRAEKSNATARLFQTFAPQVTAPSGASRTDWAAGVL